ncbi:PHP domain-containing protein [Floccifex sp.]|uniref:PHP domain-containing protein n=1 Tax=Floccifex sp. TaxID=2815810 RepID=UPI002A74F05E|nr:PHP domain-containing protein [Floccifex sp.]MDY2957999.1 PHP domain-containing protein [Floccifex sp.]
MEKNYSFVDLSMAYFEKKSKIYKEGGYKKAISLKKNKEDYENHLFVFLIDLNICLLPVYLWVLEFLLILTGLIPPRIFDLLFYIMYALLFVVSVILLPLFTTKTKGVTFGGEFLDMRIVNRKNQIVEGLPLLLRQAIGMGIPLMLFGYLFKTAGIVAWWLLNGIVSLVMPNQQTIVDVILGLHLVYEPEVNICFEQAKQEQEICPIDLHIRSNYSDDGYYDVEEIFKQAKELGLETISITDHNCARQNAAALRFASLYGIQYIPGVELDAQYGDLRVRVLGYYIDWEHEIFDALERASLKREKENSLLRVKKFEEYSGVSIDVNSLMETSRFQTITATDITNMVFNNERVRSLSFVKKYIDSTDNINEAMKQFKFHIFGKGGPCYVKGKYPRLEDVIKAIHISGGICVLASWHMDYIDDETIQKIVDKGIDGIECFSPCVQEETISSLLKIAMNNKLLISCGSDYHGPTKQDRHLGQTHCPEKGLQLVRILTNQAN